MTMEAFQNKGVGRMGELQEKLKELQASRDRLSPSLSRQYDEIRIDDVEAEMAGEELKQKIQESGVGEDPEKKRVIVEQSIKDRIIEKLKKPIEEEISRIQKEITEIGEKVERFTKKTEEINSEWDKIKQDKNLARIEFEKDPNNTEAESRYDKLSRSSKIVGSEYYEYAEVLEKWQAKGKNIQNLEAKLRELNDKLADIDKNPDKYNSLPEKIEDDPDFGDALMKARFSDNDEEMIYRQRTGYNEPKEAKDIFAKRFPERVQIYQTTQEPATSIEDTNLEQTKPTAEVENVEIANKDIPAEPVVRTSEKYTEVGGRPVSKQEYDDVIDNNTANTARIAVESGHSDVAIKLLEQIKSDNVRASVQRYIKQFQDEPEGQLTNENGPETTAENLEPKVETGTLPEETKTEPVEAKVREEVVESVATFQKQEKSEARAFIEEQIVKSDLSYQDADLPEPNKKAMLEWTEKSPSAGRYAEMIGFISGKESLDRVRNKAKEMVGEMQKVADRLGLKVSPHGKSISWAMWDIGKQFYFYSHPDELQEGYTADNPMTSKEKQQEIIDRHIGWEAYGDRERLLADKRFEKAFGLLGKKPKENKTLSSKDLSELGKLLRETK